MKSELPLEGIDLSGDELLPSFNHGKHQVREIFGMNGKYFFNVLIQKNKIGNLID